ncbi:unnamed protein product [Amoebophrya sp. A25]|nr:unnamed protein product [Amoebophrya sp. A25]|eukprot:GSA25T00026626001.1
MEIVRAYVTLKLASGTLDERIIAETVWWHMMKATEYRRRGLFIPPATTTEQADLHGEHNIQAVDHEKRSSSEQIHDIMAQIPFEASAIELRDGLFKNPLSGRLVSYNLFPLLLGGLPFAEVFDWLSTEFLKMPWRLPQACKEQEALLTPGGQELRGQVCPPCGVLPHQVEWFHEQVFLARFVADVGGELAAKEQEENENAEKNQSADRWRKTKKAMMTNKNAESYSSSSAIIEDQVASFRSHKHVFHRDLQVRSWIPFDLDTEEEAWAVVLTGLPDDETGGADTKQERSWMENEDFKKILRNLHVYITAIRVLARSVLKRAKVRRPFLVLHTSKRLLSASERRQHECESSGKQGELQPTTSTTGKQQQRLSHKQDNEVEDFSFLLDLLRRDGLTPVYVPPPEVEHLPRTVKVRGDDEFTDDDSWRQTLTSSWWSKIRLWQLTQYRKIVYLDADMLAMQNLEPLFSIDADFALPLYEDSVIGLMVIRPNVDTYNHMLAELGAEAERVNARLRSVDQAFQHAFWFGAGLQEAGYAVFDESGTFLHCDQRYYEDWVLEADAQTDKGRSAAVNMPDGAGATQDQEGPRTTEYAVDHGEENKGENGVRRIWVNNRPYLQPPKFAASGDKLRDYNSTEDHPLYQADKVVVADAEVQSGEGVKENLLSQTPDKEDHEEKHESSSKISDSNPSSSGASTSSYKICVLPLEYHFAVTYPQVHRLVRYPKRYSNSADLVYKVVSRVETHAKLLHWPGEKRKPWMHYSQVARTPYDSLWWVEYENLENHDRILSAERQQPTIQFNC